MYIRIHARTQACPYTRPSRIVSCETGCHSILLGGSRQAYRTFNIRGACHLSIRPSIRPSIPLSIPPSTHQFTFKPIQSKPTLFQHYPIQPPKSPSKQPSALSKKNIHIYLRHIPTSRPVLSRRTSADIPSGGVMKRSYLRGDPLQRGKVYPVNLRS